MMTVCKDQLLTYPLISDDDSVLGPTVNIPPD